MKGVMFTSFVDWVVGTRGLTQADAMLTAAEPQLMTQGAYTSVGNYPHQEMFALANALADLEACTAEEIFMEFGADAYSVLAGLQPGLVAQFGNLYELLANIESVIHSQVRKLYEGARPPIIEASLLPFGEIEVTYRSHRDFTALCQGLIIGAVRSFSPRATVTLVSHDGDEPMNMAVLRIAGWRDA